MCIRDSSRDDQATADSVGGWVGRFTGRDSDGAFAARFLRTILQAKRSSHMTTIHPVVSAGTQLVTSWTGTDLTSQPVAGMSIANVLWSLNDRSLISGGSSWAELPAETDRLQRSLAAVNDD